MRFISFDDHEPGFIAIGGIPIGIIAIGGMPIGVVAVGFGAVGGVAVSCGGAAGIVALSCGLGIGGYASTVGVSFGLKASSVGSEVSVLPDEDDPFPRAAPVPKTPHDKTSKLVVPIESIGAKVPKGWAIVEPARSSEYQPWGVTIANEQVPISPGAATTLRNWDGVTGPVLAHFTSALAAPQGEGGGYRDTAPPRFALSIDDLILPTTPQIPAENLNLTGRRVWWITKLVAKALVWLVCIAIALTFVVARFSELDMTRKTSTEWFGTVKRVEGMVFPPDTKCRVQSAMRSDGKSSVTANVSVTCGSLELYPSNHPKCSVTEKPVVGQAGHYTYDLFCTDEGDSPSEDHSGRPSLDLSTKDGRLVLQQRLPQPFKIEIALDTTSNHWIGEPLFLGNQPAAGSGAPSAPSAPSTPSSLR